MFGRSLEDAEAWVHAWSEQATQRAEAAERMATEVTALSAVAVGGSGAITVAVDAAGVLTRLELTDDVRSMSGRELAAEIMRTLRGAQRRLTEQVSSVVADTLGADTSAGSAVIGSFERRFPRRDGDD